MFNKNAKCIECCRSQIRIAELEKAVQALQLLNDDLNKALKTLLSTEAATFSNSSCVSSFAPTSSPESTKKRDFQSMQETSLAFYESDAIKSPPKSMTIKTSTSETLASCTSSPTFAMTPLAAVACASSECVSESLPKVMTNRFIIDLTLDDGENATGSHDDSLLDKTTTSQVLGKSRKAFCVSELTRLTQQSLNVEDNNSSSMADLVGSNASEEAGKIQKYVRILEDPHSHSLLCEEAVAYFRSLNDVDGTFDECGIVPALASILERPYIKLVTKSALELSYQILCVHSCKTDSRLSLLLDYDPDALVDRLVEFTSNSMMETVNLNAIRLLTLIARTKDQFRSALKATDLKFNLMSIMSHISLENALHAAADNLWKLLGAMDDEPSISIHSLTVDSGSSDCAISIEDVNGNADAKDMTDNEFQDEAPSHIAIATTGSSSASPATSNKKTPNANLMKGPMLVQVLQSHVSSIEDGVDTEISYCFMFDLIELANPPLKELDECNILTVIAKRCLMDITNGELLGSLRWISKMLEFIDSVDERTNMVVALGIIPRLLHILSTYDYGNKSDGEEAEVLDILFTAMRILNHMVKLSDDLFNKVVEYGALPVLLSFITHPQPSKDYLWLQVSDILATLSIRANFCCISKLDIITLLLGQGSTHAVQCNAFEIVHNLITLEGDTNSSGKLSAAVVECLIKPDGIVKHLVAKLTSYKGLTKKLIRMCLKTLTVVMAKIPNEVKVVLSQSHNLIDVVGEHLQPLSHLWKIQGCTMEAMQCLLILVKDAPILGTTTICAECCNSKTRIAELENKILELQAIIAGTNPANSDAKSKPMETAPSSKTSTAQPFYSAWKQFISSPVSNKSANKSGSKRDFQTMQDSGSSSSSSFEAVKSPCKSILSRTNASSNNVSSSSIIASSESILPAIQVPRNTVPPSLVTPAASSNAPKRIPTIIDLSMDDDDDDCEDSRPAFVSASATNVASDSKNVELIGRSVNMDIASDSDKSFSDGDGGVDKDKTNNKTSGTSDSVPMERTLGTIDETHVPVVSVSTECTVNMPPTPTISMPMAESNNAVSCVAELTQQIPPIDVRSGLVTPPVNGVSDEVLTVLKQHIANLGKSNLSSTVYEEAFTYIKKNLSDDNGSIEESGILSGLAPVLLRPYTREVTKTALCYAYKILKVNPTKIVSRLRLFLGDESSERKMLYRLVEFTSSLMIENLKSWPIMLIDLIARTSVHYRSQLRAPNLKINLTNLMRSCVSKSLSAAVETLWMLLFVAEDNADASQSQDDSWKPDDNGPLERRSEDLGFYLEISTPKAASNPAVASPVPPVVATASDSSSSASSSDGGSLSSAPTGPPSDANDAVCAPVKDASRQDVVPLTVSSAVTATDETTSSSSSSSSSSPSASTTRSSGRHSTAIKTPKAVLLKLIKGPQLMTALQNHASFIARDEDSPNSYQFFFDVLVLDHPPMNEIDGCDILTVMTKRCLLDISNGEMLSALTGIMMILLMAEGSDVRTNMVVELGIVPRLLHIINTYDYVKKPNNEESDIQDILFNALRVLNHIMKSSDELFDVILVHDAFPSVLKIITHPQPCEFLWQQATDILKTVSVRINFCSVATLDTILLLLEKSSTSALLSNAFEIVHNLLTLEVDINANGKLNMTSVACLMKSGGILEHLVAKLSSKLVTLTLLSTCIKTLGTVLAVIPTDLKLDFVLGNNLIDIVSSHLKPLSPLWKPQGCTVEAINCMRIIFKDVTVLASTNERLADLLRSYCRDSLSAPLVTSSTELAQCLGIDL